MPENNSRTSLFLMELIIAVFFFSLAAAVSIRLFVGAHKLTEKSTALSNATIWSQNLAEAFYESNGDVSKIAELYPYAYVTEDGIAASQLSPAESHNGRNYNWTIKRDYAEITMGSTLNAAIKTLANGSSLAYTYQDQAVTKIVFKVNQDLSGLTGGVDVSTPKDGSVILTFDGGVATISTNYQKLRSNDNISYTFRDFRELTRVEGFELIDTRNATNSRNLVYCAMKLEYINVSKMNTSNITNMTSMFCDAPALTQEVFDFSNWDTGNVETMNYMFDSVSVETLDLSAFDTKKVTTMAMMFTNCFNLKNLNISSFNTANVTTLDNMFEDCQKLESLDLRHFVTTKVTDLRSFCNRCYALKTIDLSSFNTKSVGRFSWMFNDCQELETIIVGPNFSGDKATTLQETFRNCYKLKNIDMSHFVSSSALTTSSYTLATQSSVSSSMPDTIFLMVSSRCTLSPGLIRSGE